MDALATASRAWTKVHHEMLGNVQPQVRQELLITPLLTVQLVDPTQATSAIWVGLQVIQVIAALVMSG